ncbi:MAG: hypothetical protein NZM28_08305 [Fimbriimonadales bacterium]|nr:hypothetical protein [Fimbriimonadales bacterium]
MWGQTMRWTGLLWMGVLAWGLACADDTRLQQTVSLQEPAQSVAQLMRTLSERTGVRFFPAPPLDREILLVDAENLPLKQLMNALADALDAEWFEQADGTYRLSRTAKRFTERRRADDAELKRLLPRALEQHLKEVESLRWTRENLVQELRNARERMNFLLETPSDDYRSTPEYRALLEQSRRLNSAERLLWRILERIDAQRLLNVPVRERRVFSALRGRYLEPLGFDVQPLLRQFAQEQSLLGQLWRDPADGVAELEERLRSGRFGSLLTFQWETLPEPTPLQPSALQLYLEVERIRSDSFSFVLYVQDTALRRVYKAWRMLALRSEESPMPEGAWREQPVQWSEATRLLVRATQNYSEVAFARGREASDSDAAYRLNETQPRLLDPALTEPHSMFSTDLLRSYARARGKPLVAAPHEDHLIEIFAVYLQQLVSAPRTRLAQLERLLRSYVWRERDGVLIALPWQPSYRWGDRFDRAGVSRVSARALQQGYLTLDDWLEWAQVESLSGRHGEFWAMQRGAEMLRFATVKIERLLNRLSAQERDALLSGAEVRLDQMSPALRNAILHLVYYDEDGATLSRRDRSVLGLPHALFPNGLPPESVLRVQPSETARCVAHAPKDGLSRGPQPLSDSPLADGANDALAELEGLFGVEILYNLHLVLPDGETSLYLGSVRDFRPLVDKPTRWKELPESLRARLLKLAQEEEF